MGTATTLDYMQRKSDQMGERKEQYAACRANDLAWASYPS